MHLTFLEMERGPEEYFHIQKYFALAVLVFIFLGITTDWYEIFTIGMASFGFAWLLDAVDITSGRKATLHFRAARFFYGCLVLTLILPAVLECLLRWQRPAKAENLIVDRVAEWLKLHLAV
jgi:TctA family transporter